MKNLFFILCLSIFSSGQAFASDEVDSTFRKAQSSYEKYSCWDPQWGSWGLVQEIQNLVFVKGHLWEGSRSNQNAFYKLVVVVFESVSLNHRSFSSFRAKLLEYCLEHKFDFDDSEIYAEGDQILRSLERFLESHTKAMSEFDHLLREIRRLYIRTEYSQSNFIQAFEEQGIQQNDPIFSYMVTKYPDQELAALLSGRSFYSTRLADFQSLNTSLHEIYERLRAWNRIYVGSSDQEERYKPVFDHYRYNDDR